MVPMRAFCLLFLVLASGCSHTQVNGGAFYVQTGPALAAALGAAVIAASVSSQPDYSPGMAPASNRPAPEMLADRAIAEQDCTRPIEDWSANLKCR
jgi:hypothetical protein